MTPETRIRHSAEGAGGGFPPPTPACAAFTSPATPVATSPGLDGRGLSTGERSRIGLT